MSVEYRKAGHERRVDCKTGNEHKVRGKVGKELRREKSSERDARQP